MVLQFLEKIVQRNKFLIVSTYKPPTVLFSASEFEPTFNQTVLLIIFSKVVILSWVKFYVVVEYY